MQNDTTMPKPTTQQRKSPVQSNDNNVFLFWRTRPTKEKKKKMNDNWRRDNYKPRSTSRGKTMNNCYKYDNIDLASAPIYIITNGSEKLYAQHLVKKGFSQNINVVNCSHELSGMPDSDVIKKMTDVSAYNLLTRNKAPATRNLSSDCITGANSVYDMRIHLAHIKTWEIIRNDRVKNALVFGPNIMCDPDIVSILNNISKELKQSRRSFDMLIFGWEKNGTRNQKRVTPSLDRVNSPIYGLHGYAIAREGVFRLLQRCFPISVPAGVYVGCYSYMHNKFKVYCTITPIVGPVVDM